MQPQYDFVEPKNKPYNPFLDHAVARDLFGKLTEWTLDVTGSAINLSNVTGTSFYIGKLSEPVRRCSLAFMNLTTPYIILEMVSGNIFLHKLNLSSGTAFMSESIDVTFRGLRDVTLTYCKQLAGSGLLVTALSKTGVVRSILDMDNKLTNTNLQVVNKTIINEQHSIHRVGLNTNNEFVTELVKVSGDTT